MKLNKKVIESAIVFAFAGALTITAVTNSETTVIANTSLEENGIAGVTAELYEYQKQVAEELATDEIVTVEAVEAEVVTASEDEASKDEAAEVEESTKANSEDTVEEDKMQTEWSDKLMADVDEFLYVRAEDSEDATIVGKMYKGDRALVKEEGDTWTKIESGSVTGYVKNEYCVVGKDALEYAKKNCDVIATVSIDGLRIRDEQSTDASVITALASGEKLKIKKDADTKDGWIAVIYDGQTRYVSEEYVTISYDTGKAITLEEEQAAIAAAEAEKAAGASTGSSNSSGSSQKNGAKKSQGSSVSANTDDVTLLAALIQCEAGGCSYDCQLAVGSVVVNRVKSGSFPNTVYKVIYQRGQFGPASSGKLASRIKKGVSKTARRAAQAALSGTDNTNGAKYFKLASSGHKGVKYGPIVFY